MEGTAGLPDSETLADSEGTALIVPEKHFSPYAAAPWRGRHKGRENGALLLGRDAAAGGFPFGLGLFRGQCLLDPVIGDFDFLLVLVGRVHQVGALTSQ